MDSKLVVEQMSGRWKIKHPDMRPLATEAQPAGAVRHDVHLGAARAEQARRPARQRGARRQARRRDRGRRRRTRRRAGRPLIEEVESPDAPRPRPARPRLVAAGRPADHAGPGPARRHAAHRRASGSPAASASANPGPQRRGPRPDPRHRRLAGADRRAASTPWSPRRYAARWSPPRSSPSVLGKPVEVEPGFAEMEFGAWDGLTFAEVAEQHKAELDAWLGSLDVGARGRRVVPRRSRSGCSTALRAPARGARRQDRGRGQPRDADQDPGRARASTRRWTSVFRMELSPASVTVLAFYARRGRREAARLDAALQRAAAGRRRVRLAVRLGARQDDECWVARVIAT